MIRAIAGLVFIIFLIVMILFSYLDKRKKRHIRRIPGVSFIIPCYNHGNLVSKTISSIYRVVGKEADVIVINDGSTDNSEEILNKLREKYPFRLINNSKNLGKSESLNRYSEKAKHDILFFVDSDVIINKEAVYDVLARLENKKVGAVSCPHVPRNKGFIPIMQHIEYNMKSLFKGSYNLFSTVFLWGGFIGIKKDAFLSVGKFSLNAITEDLDLAFRLNKDFKVEQSFVTVDTYVPDDFKKWFKQKIRWSAGMFQCLIKHYRIWLNNPIHLFFLFVYSVFIISAIVGIIHNLIFLGDIVSYFRFVNKIAPLTTSLKLTGLLYGATIIKDVLWILAFAFFSLPYVLPLVNEINRIPLVFLVIPFSIIYIPLFSIVFVLASILVIYKFKELDRNVRAW